MRNALRVQSFPLFSTSVFNFGAGYSRFFISADSIREKNDGRSNEDRKIKKERRERKRDCSRDIGRKKRTDTLTHVGKKSIFRDSCSTTNKHGVKLSQGDSRDCSHANLILGNGES